MIQGRKARPQAFSHAQTTARQRLVIELLSMGTKAADIATRLGISENGARKLMARALKAQAVELLSTEAHERAAALYLLWHDGMLQAWMPYALGRIGRQVQAPDKDAADVVLKLMKQFADVYGLNAPVLVQPVAPAADGLPVRPQQDLVAAVMKHLDELAERQFPPPIIQHELEAQATPIPEVNAASPE